MSLRQLRPLWGFRRFLQTKSPNLKELEKLKSVGFSEEDSKEILKYVNEEVEKFIKEISHGVSSESHSTLEQLKQFQKTFDEKMNSASAFVISTSPFQMNLLNNSTFPNNPAPISILSSMIDPAILEKEIKSTGQQLADEIKQIRADLQLDSNLEAKRREEIDLELESKLIKSSEYSVERIKQLNEHLDRVSRQALTAIGGNRS